MTPFKLSMAVSILPPVESILHRLFTWQSENAWCWNAFPKTPLVSMSNMARSPAALALDKLIMMLGNMGDDDSQLDSPDKYEPFMRTFLFLHRGVETNVCKFVSIIRM